MKKKTLIVVVLFLMFLTGCDLFGSSSNRPDFKFHFKTAKDHYTADSTSYNPVHIRAKFINQSNQTLYLGHQGCLLTTLEKLHALTWKTIFIPILCPAVVRGPVKVKPDSSVYVGIDLNWWGKPVEPLKRGVYRFTLSVRNSFQKQPVKITSNRFRISY